MSNIQSNSNVVGDMEEKLEHTFTSGHPGTTGREPFEEPSGQIPSGEHHHHHHHQHDHVVTGSRDIAQNTSGDYSSGQGNTSGQGYSSQGGLGRAGQDTTTFGGVAGSGYDGSAQSGQPQQEHHHRGVEGAAVGGAAATGLGASRHQEGEGGISGEGPHDAAQYTAAKYGSHTLKEGYGDSYGSNPAGNTSGGYHDNANSVTGHNSADRSGPGVGDSYGSNSASQNAGVGIGSNADNHGKTDQAALKANEPSVGDAGGAFGTSSGDFTGASRGAAGSGAYADTHGAFENNKSGPDGNSALTGREGDVSNNPVANATGNKTGTEHNSAEKPGLIQKIKDML